MLSSKYLKSVCIFLATYPSTPVIQEDVVQQNFAMNPVSPTLTKFHLKIKAALHSSATEPTKHLNAGIWFWFIF